MSIIKNKKIIVGVSGGVDSSVALILLKKQGWKPIAVTLRLPIWENKCNALCENVCCTKESRERARVICKKLKVPYHIVDARADFNKNVVDYFVSEYESGRTPNPCAVCNRKLKFKYLFDFAKKHGIKFVATGHYAKIARDKDGEYFLARAKDRKKDQTYSLSFLKKEWMKNIIFPLADLTKNEVYEIARDNGFDFYEKIKQSQDFCFVSGKALPIFLRTTIKNSAGKFATLDGKIVGKHDGAFLYTIGQRKGIAVPNGPWYVIATDTRKNIVFISKNEKDLFKKQLTATNAVVSFRPRDARGRNPWLKPISAKVKIRSTHEPAPAIITKTRNKLTITFAKKQRAITPGQIAVFYKNNRVLGAGRIA